MADAWAAEAQLVHQPPGAPPRVLASQLAHQRLDLGRQPVRAGPRAPGAVGQPRHALLLEPAPPAAVESEVLIDLDSAISSGETCPTQGDTERFVKALASEKRLQILHWLKQPRAHFPPQVDGDLVKDGVCGLFIAQKLGGDCGRE